MRLIVTLFTIISALLLVLSIVLWSRSTRYYDELLYVDSAGTGYYTISQNHYLLLIRSTHLQGQKVPFLDAIHQKPFLTHGLHIASRPLDAGSRVDLSLPSGV